MGQEPMIVRMLAAGINAYFAVVIVLLVLAAIRLVVFG
jgi:hypothetical protein